ncbi:hypothetical protein Tco_1372407 [Tanacetum coccineum]
MSQSLSSNVPDNSLEQEAATGHFIPRRLDSLTSQAIQIPELELTLTPTTGRGLSQEINNHDTEDKELLISELQDSLAAAENEIAIVEDRHADDHEKI